MKAHTEDKSHQNGETFLQKSRGEMWRGPFGFHDTHLLLSRTSHADGGEAPASIITPSKQTGGHLGSKAQ